MTCRFIISDVPDEIEVDASTLGFPVGFWPSDMKCPKCSHNAYFLRDKKSDDYSGGIMERTYMCEKCEQEIHVFND